MKGRTVQNEESDTRVRDDAPDKVCGGESAGIRKPTESATHRPARPPSRGPLCDLNIKAAAREVRERERDPLSDFKPRRFDPCLSRPSVSLSVVRRIRSLVLYCYAVKDKRQSALQRVPQRYSLVATWISHCRPASPPCRCRELQSCAQSWLVTVAAAAATFLKALDDRDSRYQALAD